MLIEEFPKRYTTQNFQPVLVQAPGNAHISVLFFLVDIHSGIPQSHQYTYYHSGFMFNWPEIWSVLLLITAYPGSVLRPYSLLSYYARTVHLRSLFKIHVPVLHLYKAIFITCTVYTYSNAHIERHGFRVEEIPVPFHHQNHTYFSSCLYLQPWGIMFKPLC